MDKELEEKIEALKITEGAEWRRTLRLEYPALFARFAAFSDAREKESMDALAAARQKKLSDAADYQATAGRALASGEESAERDAFMR